jgi:hypothetical protein
MIERFPQVIISKLEDPVEDFLYSTAGSIFSSYFSTRVSMESADEFGDFQKMLVQQIEEARAGIVLRRRDYRISGDLDDFISYVMPTLEHVLKSSARVLGIQHAIGRGAEISEDLRALLEEIQMLSWFELFATDLDAFYRDLDNWSKFEELFFTCRHTERWLLLFGILVDRSDNYRVYLHVPLGSDTDYLMSIS